MSALGLFAPRRLWRLVAGDAMNIARDPMLLFATAMSLTPALALSLTRDPLDAAALSTFGIADFSRYVVPFALLIPAILIGWVTGFLLLEDRDEGTLLALDITPVGKSGFLIYRVSITALLAVALTLYAWPLILPGASPILAAALSVLVGANAIAFTVALPAIARNKVEGLALTKLTNLFAVVPLLAAIPSPWRFLAAPIPSYWVGELLNLTDVAALPLWLAASLGLVVSAAALVGLFALFARRAG
jgi:fluoroquinolone transport system permease protein